MMKSLFLSRDYDKNGGYVNTVIIPLYTDSIQNLVIIKVKGAFGRLFKLETFI